jgi:altronate dehydratase large subunit
MNFQGYLRDNGEIGSRNYVAVIPTVFCVNEVVSAIVRQTEMTRGILHHQGCCQLQPDLTQVTEALIALGSNPNVGAVLIVSLGCEGVDINRVVAEIAKTGKPVEHVVLQELGGSSRCIQKGVDCVQKLIQSISLQQRQTFPLSMFTMGIKCGSSDTTSGISANPVVGYVADRVVEAGGTVIFGETTEFIGTEPILKRRAINAEVAEKIDFIINRMEKRAMRIGVDMRTGQPTPGNIKGGLSSIEEKSLGAIVKSGTKLIQGVLEYTQKPSHPGLWIKDCPGRENEVLTAMAIGGAQTILFSTGRGAPQGFPIVPVIKICGNPSTYEKLQHDMDINAGMVITGERSIEQVGELAFASLIEVLSGKATKSEAMHYNTTMDIYVTGPVI